MRINKDTVNVVNERIRKRMLNHLAKSTKLLNRIARTYLHDAFFSYEIKVIHNRRSHWRWPATY